MFNFHRWNLAPAVEVRYPNTDTLFALYYICIIVCNFLLLGWVLVSIVLFDEMPHSSLVYWTVIY
jgi:hypothetical protein